MSDLKRCYDILEIKPGSSYEEAKLAFRDMVSIWHPDKFSNNARLQEKAEEKLKDLNAAWEELQAFFVQKKDAAAKQPRKELAEPEESRLSQERTHRQRDGKAVRTDCRFADLELEPLVHLEQARKAYRHRFPNCHPGLDPSLPGAAHGADSDCDAIALEELHPRKSAGEVEQYETARHEQEPLEKMTGAARQQEMADKEPIRGNRAAQTSIDELFNESDRKIKLLSDSYLLGSLERKFVNWQQREREDKKLQDAAKDAARRTKKMADLFLTRYKTWLAGEMSQYKASSKIRSLFKIYSSPGGGGSTGKFLFGVPDINLAFVKGGSFLMGNDPGNTIGKMPRVNGEQPYRVVTVEGFYIGKYPVTMRQWSKVMGVEVEGAEQDFPVLLNWDGVQECISRLNDITGLKFRVPTEAEWEYAARSGGNDENWSGIFNGSAIPDQASLAGCKAGQSKTNGLGFFDMLGNSNEWATGSSAGLPRQNCSQGSAKGAGNGGRMVIRGAVQWDLPKHFTTSYTFHRSFLSSDKTLRFGFRLAHATF